MPAIIDVRRFVEHDHRILSVWLLGLAWQNVSHDLHTSAPRADKQAYDTLTELYRRTMTRLGGDLPQKQPSKSEISGPDVRQWAKENGISVPRTGRIPLRVENAYRAAHGLTQRASVERIFYVSNFHASASQIRDWARQNGIPVGKRGRLHPDVIRAYASASVVVTK